MEAGYLSKGQQGLRQIEDRCIQEHAAACTAACPLHVDVRSMAAEISHGSFGRALKSLKKAIPFPGIISRVCEQPCRAACKRSDKGGSISISALERACVSFGTGAKDSTFPVFPTNKKVAVIGGGLSGAAVAFFLARKGHSVTLFEGKERLGGSLWEIAEKQLPRQLILGELAILRDVGVEVKLGSQVGRDIPFESVCNHFDALFLGIGAGRPDGFGLQLDEQGRIAVDDVTLTTSREGVFAGGALRQEPGKRSFIGSLADGRYAAVSIDRYLHKASLAAERDFERSYSTRLYTNTEGVEPLPAVPMADPDLGYSEDEAVREASRCLLCQCLECVKVCEYLNHFGSYPKKYLRQIYNNLAIVSGNRTANKLINSCSLCGLCMEVCPEQLDMGEICLEAREIMVARDKMPPSAHDFAIRDMLFSIGEKSALARHQPGHVSSNFLFFPGCQLGASAPGLVEESYSYLMERLTGGVGLMLGCCGAPAEWAGQQTLFQSCWESIEATWQEMGRPRWILACSSCYQIFKARAAEGMEITSLWEIIDELGLPVEAVANGQGDRGEGTASRGGVDNDECPAIAIHDPCAARHDVRIQDSVRRILSRLGYSVEELPLNRQRTECCGYGGLMSFANPELAHKVTRRRIEANAKDYVTYCAMCRDRFAAQGKRTLYLLDLVFGMNRDESSTRQSPGYSQRHENRARLKNRLLKTLWGEREVSPLEYERIKLSIPTEVKERMESRLILVEDVQQVIDFAERTGRKLMHPSNTHFLAHFKPAAVTYWVEYSKDGDHFVVHNAYSHRMEIFEDVTS